MRRNAATILFAMLLSGATVSTQPTESVNQLIAQLGSDDYHARQAAADRFVDRGDAVRPQLEKLAADPSDAERRNLAAGILTRLDRIEREGPTFITLHAHEAGAQSVLDDLTRQANVAIHFSPNASRGNRLPRVTIDIDHKPFWIALAALCRLTRTSVQAGDIPIGIELGTGRSSEALDGPLCQAGPFVVAIESATRDSHLRYGDSHGVVNDDSINLELFIDPKSHTLETPAPTIDEVIDKSGRSLLPTERLRTSWSGLRGRWTRSFATGLTLGPDTTALKRLHGTIDATFAVETQTITIPDIQLNQHQFVSAGDASIAVESATVAPRGGTYILSLKRKTPGILNLFGLKLIDTEKVILFDAKGSAMISGDGVFTLNGAFNKSTDVHPPISLVWEVPTRAETIHEPFEFTDLPLP